MHLPQPPRRRRAVWAAAAFTATALLTASTPALAAGTAPSAEVDSTLTAAVAKGGDATFFVVLKDQADLSGAKKQKTHAARARAAFKELRANAADSQASLTSFLDKKEDRPPGLLDRERDPGHR